MTDFNLASVFPATPTPTSTAFVGALSRHPQAASVTRIRWRNQRRELEQLGASAETLEAMDRAMDVDTEAVTSGPGQPSPDNVNTGEIDDLADHVGADIIALVAAGNEVLLHTFIDATAAKDQVKFGALPRMTPLLEAQQAWVPHLVALVDRVGADIWGVDQHGYVLGTKNVDGQDFQITKVRGGGWSHSRIHERAVNRWTANAKDVAAKLGELTRAHRPVAVFLGGDDTAARLVEEQLGGDVTPLLRKLDAGTRANDGNDDAYEAEIERQLNSVVAEQAAEDLSLLKQRLGGEGSSAVAGMHDVVEALQQARVDTLFLPRKELETELAFGPEPTSIAEQAEELTMMGITGIDHDAASDVLARAALLTGATVKITAGSALPHGVAALLRGG